MSTLARALRHASLEVDMMRKMYGMYGAALAGPGAANLRNPFESRGIDFFSRVGFSVGLLRLSIYLDLRKWTCRGIVYSMQKRWNRIERRWIFRFKDAF